MRILGMYQEGSREASVLGAYLLGRPFKLSPETVARMVLDEFGRQMALEIVSHGFEKDGISFRPEDFQEKGLFGARLGLGAQGHVGVGLAVSDPVVLLGAPAAILAPFLGRILTARIFTPPVFEVASAVGAAASPVYLTRCVEIHTLPNFAGYRLFLPDRVVDGGTIDGLVDVAVEYMAIHMRSLAILAGEDNIDLSCVREDRRAALSDGSRLELGTTLVFAATPLKGRRGEKKSSDIKGLMLVKDISSDFDKAAPSGNSENRCF